MVSFTFLNAQDGSQKVSGFVSAVDQTKEVKNIVNESGQWLNHAFTNLSQAEKLIRTYYDSNTIEKNCIIWVGENTPPVYVEKMEEVLIKNPGCGMNPDPAPAQSKFITRKVIDIPESIKWVPKTISKDQPLDRQLKAFCSSENLEDGKVMLWQKIPLPDKTINTNHPSNLERNIPQFMEIIPTILCEIQIPMEEVVKVYEDVIQHIFVSTQLEKDKKESRTYELLSTPEKSIVLVREFTVAQYITVKKQVLKSPGSHPITPPGATPKPIPAQYEEVDEIILFAPATDKWILKYNDNTHKVE